MKPEIPPNPRCNLADRLRNVIAGKLSSRNGSQNNQRLFSSRDFIRQTRINGLVRQVLLASEETQKGSTLLRGVIADGAAQHGIALLERIEDRLYCDFAVEFEFHIAANLGQSSQMWR